MGKLFTDVTGLIKEFISTIREKYPDLTEKQLIEVCKGQFLNARKEIEKGSLRTIRIKYFGSFRVYRSRAVGVLNFAKRRYENGKVSKQRYEELQHIVEAFLEEEEQEEDEDNS